MITFYRPGRGKSLENGIHLTHMITFLGRGGDLNKGKRLVESAFSCRANLDPHDNFLSAGAGTSPEKRV
jgi:hypothetical protein